MDLYISETSLVPSSVRQSDIYMVLWDCSLKLLCDVLSILAVKQQEFNLRNFYLFCGK